MSIVPGEIWAEWTDWGRTSPGHVVDLFANDTLNMEHSFAAAYKTATQTIPNESDDEDTLILEGSIWTQEGWHRYSARVAAYSGAALNTDPGYAKDRGWCMDALGITLCDPTIPSDVLARVAGTLASGAPLHPYSLIALQCLASHPNADEGTVEAGCLMLVDFVGERWWGQGTSGFQRPWERQAYATLQDLLSPTPTQLPMVNREYLTRPDAISDTARSRMLVTVAARDLNG